MEKIKTAIIGMGMMGFSQLINCFLPSEDFEVTAVCDIYEPHLKKVKNYLQDHHLKIQVFRDYKKMLAEADFSLAAIVTPDFTHADIAADCLKAGKHLRLEKPMAITTEDCEKIYKLWQSYPQIVQIGYELRYSPVISQMRHLLPFIGTPKLMWCHEFRHPFLSKDGQIPDWIIKKQYSGGTLLEKNCHHFDLFNMFAASKPISVYASGDNQVIYRNTDVLDNAFVTVNYENGCRAMLSLCMFAPELKHQKHMHAFEFGILGENGRIEIKDDTLYLWERNAKSETVFTYFRENTEAHSEDIIPSLNELADCIRQHRQPFADIDAGISSARLALAAEASAASSRLTFL